MTTAAGPECKEAATCALDPGPDLGAEETCRFTQTRNRTHSLAWWPVLAVGSPGEREVLPGQPDGRVHDDVHVGLAAGDRSLQGLAESARCIGSRTQAMGETTTRTCYDIRGASSTRHLGAHPRPARPGVNRPGTIQAELPAASQGRDPDDSCPAGQRRIVPGVRGLEVLDGLPEAITQPPGQVWSVFAPQLGGAWSRWPHRAGLELGVNQGRPLSGEVEHAHWYPAGPRRIAHRGGGARQASRAACAGRWQNVIWDISMADQCAVETWVDVQARRLQQLRDLRGDGDRGVGTP
jgi:hypothetical protein